MVTLGYIVFALFGICGSLILYLNIMNLFENLDEPYDDGDGDGE